MSILRAAAASASFTGGGSVGLMGILTFAHLSMLAVESDTDLLLDRLAATQHVLIPKPVHHTTRLVGAPNEAPRQKAEPETR